ncbi:MAG: WYL domain-containing protein [Roseiarcus sp.]
MDKPDERIRWGTEQRLEFIEFRTFWEGGVNRSDITQRFGVSVPQASNDLTLYQKLMPSNLRYDSSEKRYVPTPDFAPRFMKPNADRYLVQLKAVSDHVLPIEDTWIVRPPDFDGMPVPTRRIDPSILKRLISTIRAERSIEIYFQSMNPKRPEAIWRRITPHALAHDGLRWHVRAFCHMESKFKDFIISRCRDLRDEDAPGAAASDDHLWKSFFDVILKPNPDLTPTQRETIALDYEMEDCFAKLSVRRALLYYFEKRLRLDNQAGKDKPSEKPVVIHNVVDFIKARDAAMA